MAPDIDLAPLASSVIAGAAVAVAAWVSSRDPHRHIKSSLQVLREMTAAQMDDKTIRQWRGMVEQQALDTTSKMRNLKVLAGLVSIGFLAVVASWVVGERPVGTALYIIGITLVSGGVLYLGGVVYFAPQGKNQQKKTAPDEDEKTNKEKANSGVAGDGYLPQDSDPASSPVPPTDPRGLRGETPSRRWLGWIRRTKGRAGPAS